MSGTKSMFKFMVHADPTVVNNVIQGYLAANGFYPVPKANANYYYFNDPLIKGKRSFEYYINGPEVTILAYLGTYERPKQLEGIVGAFPKKAYKNELGFLFEELKKLDMAAMNGMGNPMYNGNPAFNGATYGYAAQQAASIDAFVKRNRNSQENTTIVGFIISLIGIVLAFFGITYGAVLLVLEFYCGIRGLRTRLKGLAIATIVLSSLSIAVLFATVALSNYFAMY